MRVQLSACAFSHANPASASSLQPPTKAEVHFSEDGTNYHDKPLKSPSNWPPTLPAGSHNLTLDLRHRTGRVLKALFFFSGPWLAVSEVYFDSGKDPAPSSRFASLSLLYLSLYPLSSFALSGMLIHLLDFYSFLGVSWGLT